MSVGGFPTATGAGTDLAGIAEKAGAEHVALADTVEDVQQAFDEASERDGLSIIVSKVDAIGPSSFAMDISLLENRFEFSRYLKGLVP